MQSLAKRWRWERYEIHCAGLVDVAKVTVARWRPKRAEYGAIERASGGSDGGGSDHAIERAGDGESGKLSVSGHCNVHLTIRVT